MSPEERARMLRNFVCTHYRSGIGAVIGPTSGEFFCEKCVAHEIRAAENEALERANEAIERIPAHRGAEMDMKRAAWNAVNALKSKPPEGK